MYPPTNPTPPKRGKPTRVPFREETSAWAPGEVIAYRLPSGQSILMQVCGHFGSELNEPYGTPH